MFAIPSKRNGPCGRSKYSHIRPHLNDIRSLPTQKPNAGPARVTYPEEVTLFCEHKGPFHYQTDELS